MKVLTIKQPWAVLIIDGYKKYEFRSWKTNYRGKILIHAGMGSEKEMLLKVEDYHLTYHHGAIIGEADVVDCILVDDFFDQQLRQLDPIIYGNDHTGLYAWKLENIKKYDEAISIKGKLGLWNYEEE